MEETTNTSTTKDWLFFLISLVAMIILFAVADEWFWLALPFVLTFFVKAIRMM
ncbi:hypothetical protein [Haliscomenobacter sp.]|uniref:hypothetical protein n=1 Tax=Haliscomenobacter sp. TaxID=2717303 RepID=UPI0035941DE3